MSSLNTHVSTTSRRKNRNLDNEDRIMFRKVRKKANEISVEVAKQLIKTERRGILAVNGEDGYPYAIPLNYSYDEEQNKIYFHGARAGYKYDMIKNSDKVCFTVVGNEQIKNPDEPWAPYLQSAVVFGRCRFMENTPETMEILKNLAMKYFPTEDIADDMIAASGKAVQMYEIEIEHISGKEVQEK